MLNLIEASNKVKHMNYLQTQERRKFRARARQENENPLTVKDFILLIAIGLFSVIGVIAVMAMVAQSIID